MASSITRRVSHREAKKEECRKAIAAAALRLFEEKGFDATTMDEIAHAAHVSRPTVFNYFAKKEDILEVLSAMLSERLSKTMGEALGTGKTPDPLAAIRQVVRIMAGAFEEYPETSRAFHFLRMQEAKRKHVFGRECAEGPDERNAPGRRLFEGLIADAQAKGLLRKDYSPRELSFHLLIGLFAAVMGARMSGECREMSLADMLERHLDLYLQGMTA